MTQPFEDFHLFSEFPHEIQRLVFEEAFEVSERKAVHLALVSHEVRSWVEPLMYKCIVLTQFHTGGNPQGFRLFANTFYHGSKPKHFYASVVRMILIDNLFLEDLAKKFLPLCSNTTHLAIWCETGPTGQEILESIFSPDTFPKLRRLSIHPNSLPQSYQTYHHPIFRNLTHLDIVHRNRIPWDGFRSLESLTHLDLNFVWELHINTTSLESSIQSILPHLPLNLRCIVILVPTQVLASLARQQQLCGNELLKDIIQGKHHPGMVLGSLGGIGRRVKGFLTEDFLRYVVPVRIDFSAWTYLPRGRKDFWMEADEIIEKRRRDQASCNNGKESSTCVFVEAGHNTPLPLT